jgi:hypothetical protein
MPSRTTLLASAGAPLDASSSPRPRVTALVALLGSLLMVAACGQEFNSGGGGSGQGGAGAHAGSGGVSSTGGHSGGSGGSGGLGAGVPGGAGGGGGAPFVCTHELCQVDAPLVLGCDGQGCVNAICQATPLCCAWWWAAECLGQVSQLCGADACTQPPNSGFCNHLVEGHLNFTSCANGEAVGCTIQDMLPGQSCATFCALLGVDCLGASTLGASTCTSSTTVACDWSNGGTELVCHCDLSCGGFPPCPGAQVCTGGNCASQ